MNGCLLILAVMTSVSHLVLASQAAVGLSSCDTYRSASCAASNWVGAHVYLTFTFHKLCFEYVYVYPSFDLLLLSLTAHVHNVNILSPNVPSDIIRARMRAIGYLCEFQEMLSNLYASPSVL